MSNGIGVGPSAVGNTKKNHSMMNTIMKDLKAKRMEAKGNKAKGAPFTDMVSLSMEAREAGKKGKAIAEATPHGKGPKGVNGHHENGHEGYFKAKGTDLASNVSANISLNGTATGKVEEKTPAAIETDTLKTALPENDILNSLNNIDNSLNLLLSGNTDQDESSLFNNLDDLASSLGELGNLS